jgi:uncharacterized membrane protein
MAKDVGDLIGTAIGRVAKETVQTLASNNKSRGAPSLSGGKGLAAGAGLATLAPLAFKGVKGAKNLMNGSSGSGGDSDSGSGPIGKVKGKLEGNVKDKAKEGAKDALPFGGGKDKGEPGVGKGRRMPIQQSMDVPVSVATAYKQWTNFEEWPKFMHRLESVNQEDDEHLSFKAKIWGKSKEFKAEIEEQNPNERIKWKVTEGLTHTGVITFHELAPRLTRIEVNMDVQPGSLLEKAARGMRHIKRAVRADMHRWKAYVMMNEEEKGASRTASASSSSRSRSGSGSSSRRKSGSGSNGSSASSSRRRSSSSGSGRSSSAKSRSGSSNGSSSSRSGASRSTSSGRSSGSSRSSSGSRSGGSSSRAK